jgi:hypothetical protein
MNQSIAKLPITQLLDAVLLDAVAGAVMLVMALAPLTRAQLETFTYRLDGATSVDGGVVTLTDGRWKDPEGGSTFILHPTHAIGDLDADGHADAVAILVENAGGTGSFYYMFAILNRGGVPVQGGEPEWLGDRTVIQRLTIDRKGIISIRYVTHADGDAACCPTMKIEDRFRVVDGKLIGMTK